MFISKKHVVMVPSTPAIIVNMFQSIVEMAAQVFILYI
jgi:hypothetical protein